jgi:exodeoxyribonuclease V beta subunit
MPAVIYSTGNVIDSHEAVEMDRILLSIANPQKEGTLKAALATDLLGVKGEELDPERMDSNWWESKVGIFMEYYRLWNRQGFIRMFRYFMSKESVRSRLLSLPDGERRLTNVLHLAEILHTAATQKDLGMTGLLKWFSIQRDSYSPRIEENQLRLESDADAVKIITIHKSKGLEYPVVFCPFAWGKSTVDKDGFAFHDPDAGERLTLDLGSPDLEEHRILAQNELLAENLRLLYVALTRAKQKCYLVWGKINTTETSALAYLFHNPSPEKVWGAKTDIVGYMPALFAELTYEQFMTDMQRIEDKADNTIEMLSLPFNEASELGFPVHKDENLSLRKFDGNIDTSWRISSYSSLISGRAPDNELPDRDALMLPTILSTDDTQVLSNSDKTITESQDPQDKTIFSFPKGAAAGIFFHDIFENLDLANNDLTYQRELVTEKLTEHGFPLIWEAPLMEMIANVRTVSLASGKKRFCLASVPAERRVHEMAFFFPLKKIDPSAVRQVFEDHKSIALLNGFQEQLGRLTFSPTRGFMMGYIDMLFAHEDTYYIIDWKSNYLGPTIENYAGNLLNREMRRAFYILQYHLYVLATHLHLQQRNPNYTFEKNFGGVFYIYIRGVDEQKGPVYGIFEDHPDVRLINALGSALVPNYEF